MRCSDHQILTSHVGSLPRPDELIEVNRAREADALTETTALQQVLKPAVADVVRHQRKLGIDIPNDGEFGKSVTYRVHYGAWWNYAFQRWGGIEFGAPGPYGRTPQRSGPGEIVLTSQDNRRDRQLFAAAYGDPESGVSMGPRPSTGPVCAAPLTYTGHAALQADIANLKAALAASQTEEGFMTAVAPGSAYRIGNRHYQSDEEFLYACAEVMREEYKAIVEAGLILQLDDPATATGWDMITPEPSLDAYKKFTHDINEEREKRGLLPILNENWADIQKSYHPIPKPESPGIFAKFFGSPTKPKDAEAPAAGVNPLLING